MKIAVVSDTHEQWQAVGEAIAAEQGVEALIFLGDLIDDGECLQAMLDLPAYMISGNCDGYGNRNLCHVRREMMIELMGWKIFICHGDWYGVKGGLEEINRVGKSKGADIIAFGHTHIPCYEKKDCILINPGSAGSPGYTEKWPSWGLLELQEKNNAKKMIKYEKKVLQKK